MQGFRELIQLHLAHEAERKAVKQQEALRATLAAYEADIAAAKAALEAADADVKKLHADRRAAELEVQKLEDTRKKYREQLMGAKTNEIYKTLLHEIETAGHAISARETAVLEVLEAADGAAKRVADAKQALAAAEKRRADEERRLVADLETHEMERRAAEARAKELEPSVPISLLSHYRRIREGREGRGMALAVDYTCTECRVAVLPQAWVNIIAKDEPYQCAGCKRFVYRRENLAPASGEPEAPADAPVGQGGVEPATSESESSSS